MPISDVPSKDALQSNATHTKVSVIVRNYNQGKYLPQAIDSLLKQTLPSSTFEIILVDDGSDDESRAIMERYADSTRQIFLQREGAIKALNTGVAEAKGEYVTIVDADDWVEPGLLQNLLDAVEKDPRAEFSYCDYQECSDKGETKVVSLAKNPFEGLAACFLHKRSLLNEVGGYDETLQLAEYDLLAKALARSEGVHVPKALYHYRRHGNNLSNDSAMVERERMRLKERYGKNFTFRNFAS